MNSQANSIFITQRPAKAHKGGFWEFAGGKVEDGESAIEAVKRELEEEVGITAKTIEPFISLAHDYTDKALAFDFFLVREFVGEPFGKEGQPGEWVAIGELENYDFPEANHPVLGKIREVLG